jgi:hypothetical protein
MAKSSQLDALVAVGHEYAAGSLPGVLAASTTLDVRMVSAMLGSLWATGLEVGIELAMRYPEAARHIVEVKLRETGARSPQMELELEDSLVRLAGAPVARA